MPRALDNRVVDRGAVGLTRGVKRSRQHLMGFRSGEIQTRPFDSTAERGAEKRNCLGRPFHREQAFPKLIIDTRVALRRRVQCRTELTAGRLML